MRTFLSELELALKNRAGVVVEDVLWQTREKLLREVNRPEPTGLIVQDPLAIAARHGDEPQPPVNGRAPGWRICCTDCGRSSPADRVGITRIGARSLGKYVAGHCRQCGRVRPCHLIRDLHRVTIVPQLESGKQPEDIRRRSHRPYWTIAGIVLLVATIQGLVYWWLA